MLNNRFNNVSQRPGIFDKHQRSNYPQSTQNYKNRKMFIPIHKHSEYTNFIEQKLKKILNSTSGYQIVDIISSFKSILSSSNVKYSNQNNNNRISDTRDKFTSYSNNNISQQFQVLIRLYKHQLVQIFKKTAYVILNTPKSQSQSIPLLQSGQSSSASLSKPQITYLLSLMSCMLIHPSNPIHNNHNINTFCHIFQYQQYKTHTIIEYILNYFDGNRNYKYEIRRQCFKHYKTVEDLIKYKQEYEQCYLSKYYIANDQQSIENYYQDAKVDFANKKIGGGALTKGCVQQQIMFANHPQMYILSLLCQPLKDQQAIISVGFKKYFKNTGYSYQTKYAGHQKANMNSQLPEVIVSIDAEEFQNRQREQYRKEHIDREIIKAYTGFNNVKERENIITGNWGCGAFKGDAMLKFIVQYIACSLAKKNMIYCPYGMENTFRKYIILFDKFRTQKSILQLYQLVVKSCQFVKSHHDNLFEQMEKGLGYGKNNFNNLNNHNNNPNNHYNNNQNHRQNNIYTQQRRDPYNSSNRPLSSHKNSKNSYDQRQSFNNNNNRNHHQSLNKHFSNNRQTQYKSNYSNNFNNSYGISKSRIF